MFLKIEKQANMTQKIFVQQSIKKKHISGLGNVKVHNTLPRAVVTGFFTLTGRDNDVVHLLLGQPKKMMHDPPCKLILHRSAKAWLPALN